MRALRVQLLAGMSANAGGQAISIFIQLASLPLFLHFWGPSQYGVWLILSAIPAYISMADVGMVTAAGNEMTMAMGREDVRSANSILHSALLFMSLLCGAIALLGVPSVFFFFEGRLDEQLALGTLILTVLITLLTGLGEAVFRASGRYAVGTAFANVLRLGEWLGCIAGLALFETFFAVAVGGLLMRLVGLFWFMRRATLGGGGLRWSFRDASVKNVRAMFRPAISFMAFPLANALSFQGMTLLVGSLLGPLTVTVFNTYRTLARICVQGTSILSYSLGPEFAMRFSRTDSRGLSRLYRQTAAAGLIFAIVASGVLYLVAPYLLQFWTRSAVPFDQSLMALMLGYAAVSGAWHVPRVLLQSTNEHASLAVWSLFGAAGSLILATVLCQTWKLEGAAISMLVSELALASICIYLAHRLLRTVDFSLRVHGEPA